MSSSSLPDRDDDSAQTGAAVSYAILDQALWSRFREAGEPQEYLSAWLALTCRSLGPDVRGLLLMGEPDTGPFEPVAIWPDVAPPYPEVGRAAEDAARTRRGVVLGEGQAQRSLAQPIMIESRLYGVVAISAGASEAATVELFRRLSWATGWIEVLARREQEKIDSELRERTAAAFDMLATVLEQPDFVGACNALATELARRLDCDMVSIGFRRGGRCRVRAVSHAADFGKGMNLIRDIGHAMDEAADQKSAVLVPVPEDWEFRVTRAHEELLRTHKVGTALTIPLQAHDKVIGAITFERPHGAVFDAITVEICDAVAAVVGPILDDRRANDRMLPAKVAETTARQLRRLVGPSYFGRKVATLALLGLVGFFSVARDTYSVTSSAYVRGSVQRSLVAPFSGYLAAEYARAGDIVKAGQTIAVLDDQDLTLERLRLVTARRQRETEYDRALSERKRAEANFIRAQIEQADAQLALVDEQLARTRINAPFDGIVVSGDLSQNVGGSIDRGETLYQIAPLDTFRVILEIDERDIEDIEIGERGRLRVSAMPETPMPFQIERITPKTEQGDGRNYFVVEAALESVAPELRPGMRGVARTEIGERLLIQIWTDRLVDWARLAVWKWQP